MPGRGGRKPKGDRGPSGRGSDVVQRLQAQLKHLENKAAERRHDERERMRVGRATGLYTPKEEFMRDFWLRDSRESPLTGSQKSSRRPPRRRPRPRGILDLSSSLGNSTLTTLPLSPLSPPGRTATQDVDDELSYLSQSLTHALSSLGGSSDEYDEGSHACRDDDDVVPSPVTRPTTASLPPSPAYTRPPRAATVPSEPPLNLPTPTTPIIRLRGSRPSMAPLPMDDGSPRPASPSSLSVPRRPTRGSLHSLSSFSPDDSPSESPLPRSTSNQLGPQRWNDDVQYILGRTKRSSRVNWQFRPGDEEGLSPSSPRGNGPGRRSIVNPAFLGDTTAVFPGVTSLLVVAGRGPESITNLFPALSMLISCRPTTSETDRERMSEATSVGGSPRLHPPILSPPPDMHLTPGFVLENMLHELQRQSGGLTQSQTPQETALQKMERREREMRGERYAIRRQQDVALAWLKAMERESYVHPESVHRIKRIRRLQHVAYDLDPNMRWLVMLRERKDKLRERVEHCRLRDRVGLDHYVDLTRKHVTRDSYDKSRARWAWKENLRS